MKRQAEQEIVSITVFSCIVCIGVLNTPAKHEAVRYFKRSARKTYLPECFHVCMHVCFYLYDTGYYRDMHIWKLCISVSCFCSFSVYFISIITYPIPGQPVAVPIQYAA